MYRLCTPFACLLLLVLAGCGGGPPRHAAPPPPPPPPNQPPRRDVDRARSLVQSQWPATSAAVGRYPASHLRPERQQWSVRAARRQSVGALEWVGIALRFRPAHD